MANWQRIRGSIFATSAIVAMLSGCSYGPPETTVSIGNALAKPGTHILAFSTDFRRIRKPTGFLNTFPNGGVPKTLSHEARVYLVDLDRNRIERAAQIAGFAGIPQAKAVVISGWRDGSLYLRLFGYGGDQIHGDDMTDRRDIYFRIDPDGRLQKIDSLPEALTAQHNSGPLPPMPFLRISQGYRDLIIGIDARPGSTGQNAKLIVDPKTGEPKLYP